MYSLEIEPTTFFALLTQCSTTEPQEHYADHKDCLAFCLPFLISQETHKINHTKKHCIWKHSRRNSPDRLAHNSMILSTREDGFTSRRRSVEALQRHIQIDFLTPVKPSCPLAFHRNMLFSYFCADQKDSNLHKGFLKTINNCCCY